MQWSPSNSLLENVWLKAVVCFFLGNKDHSIKFSWLVLAWVWEDFSNPKISKIDLTSINLNRYCVQLPNRRCKKYLFHFILFIYWCWPYFPALHNFFLCAMLWVQGVSGSGGCLPQGPEGCAFRVWGCAHAPWTHPLDKHTHPGHPPWSTSGQYTSYWNAFLFIIEIQKFFSLTLLSISFLK